MSRQIIPIVFATDDNYAPYCGVAISSLISNAKSDHQYDIYVLHDHLAYKNIFKLEGLSRDNITIVCVCVDEHLSNMNVTMHLHFTIAANYRFVIPKVIPQFEKVIYFDSDIVINSDVAELYRIDIGDNVFGAVRGYLRQGKTDFLYNHITEKVGIKVDNFFNSGILLLNTKEFVKHGVAEKCLSILEKRQDLYFPDQDTLNMVCEGKVFFLPDRWNLDWNMLYDIYDPTLSNSRENVDTQADNAIIHFLGGEKPWDYPEQMFSDYFWKYARETVFYEEILLSMQSRRMAKMLDLLMLIDRGKNIAVYGAGTAGRKYVKDILAFRLHDIVIWVDKNFADREGYEPAVMSVDRLFSSDFDCVLIAVEYEHISNEVKKSLIEGGIPPEKIVQI